MNRLSYHFESKLKLDEIQAYSQRYTYDLEVKVELLVPTVQERGFLTKEDLMKVCRWKTPRSQKQVRENDEDLVRRATALALSDRDDRLKIHILLALNGVSMPTASVLLHWFDKLRYPIIDFRALWTLGVPDSQAYSLPFWVEYVAFTRMLADQAGVTMRTLDKALWQYSKENQKAKLTREQIIKALERGHLPVSDRNIMVIEDLLEDGKTLEYAFQLIGTTGDCISDAADDSSSNIT